MAEVEKSTASSIERAQYHQVGRNLLYAQTRAIDAIIDELHALDRTKENAAIRVPLLMLQAVGVSVHSVLALTHERSMGIRDCFGIARSAVETAVNSAFIAVSGIAAAEKAIRHMRQKRWRDLHRLGRVGHLNISVSRNIGLEANDLSGLQEALDEYTNKKGDEVRDWTPENLQKRIAAVSDEHRKAGLCLGVAYFSIYRPASELLHGTYYGVNFFWQGSRDAPALGKDDFDELWVTEHFVTLLTALFFGVSGAIEAISSIHKLPGHSKLQDELALKLSALVESMNGNGDDDGHDFRSEQA
ncbi:MAG: hypothetical protein EOP63_18270 [Sphingomonadales bacterium]|nr:MAG: hypothetical protein EOP63_18270 [Sphingomonadales bacterium]